MAQSKKDPATGRPLPKGVTFRGKDQYQARKMINGKRIMRTFASAALARRWLSEKRAEVDLGQFKDTSLVDRTPIRDLVERYRDERMSDRQADRTGHIPIILDDPVSDCMCGKWKPADVRGFRERMMAAGFEPGTVVKRMNLLASIIKYAISDWDVCMENYASGRFVRRPEGADKKRDRRLSLDEQASVLEAMSKTSYPDDVLFTRFALAQATRRGEAMGLKWSDIDFARNIISLRKTKTMKYAKVHGPEERPLMPNAKAVLLEKLAMIGTTPNPEAVVFNVGSEDAFSLRFGRQMRRFNIHDLTFHDLRHVATTTLAEIFTSPLDLKRITGHKDLKSLDRYFQPDLTKYHDIAAGK